MSITSYSDLQTKVADWMGRASNTDFTNNTTDFITLCEARINYGSDDPEFPSPALRTRQMEFSTTVTFLASTDTAILPPDYLEMRAIYDSTANPRNKLTFMTPNQMDATLITGQNGPPVAFCVQTGNLRIAPPADTTRSIVMDYYQKIGPLTNTITSNWLLNASPGIYLSGSQLEAAIFVRDTEDAAIFARLFGGLMRSFQKQDVKGKFGGDALQIKTDTGNP